MDVYLTLVEPLRARAVQRWLDRHHVLLPSAREFVFDGRPTALRGVGAAPRRMAGDLADEGDHDELHVGLIRALKAPGSYRGRALTEGEMLAACRPLREMRPGDALIVPHMAGRLALSVHIVAEPGLVTGSSQTAALPLGIAIAKSWGLDGRLTLASEHARRLWRRLPLPTGPLTPATHLSDDVAALFAAMPPDREHHPISDPFSHLGHAVSLAWRRAHRVDSAEPPTPHASKDP